MADFLTPQNIFDGLVAVGVIVYALAQWNLGRADAKSSDDKDALVALALKDQAIATLTEELKRVNAILTQDGKDIAVLQAENARLLALNANRSPEFEQFMKTMNDTIGRIESSISKFLESQNTKPVVSINNAPQHAP